MIPNQHRLTRSLLALILAALAGCGGGGGAGSAAVEQAPTAEPVPSETATEAPVPTLVADHSGSEAASQPSPSDAADSSPAATTPPSEQTLAAADTPAAATAAATSYIDLYVAPGGNDAWSGLLSSPNANGTDGPLRTIGAAQVLARVRLAAMAQGTQARAALRIKLQPGTYVLSSTLTFTPADSGTLDAPVSYEAVVPGTVVITGAVPLRQVSAGAGSTPVVFENPAAGQSAWRGGGQLFVNGRRATLARMPNVGAYAFIQKATPLATEPAGQAGREAFAATPELLNFVAALSTADRARAIVDIYHPWTSSKNYLASDAPAGSIRVTPRVYWTFLNSGTSQRYFIENVSSALDAPGEFFWDAGGVRYLLRADETSATVNATMPVLDRLIAVSGNFGTSQWVQHLQFRGITFAQTRTLVPSSGYLDWQAATALPAAIEADGAQSLLIDNCSFTGLGGYGVWLRRGVRDSKVSNSSFTDIGGGGIKIGMTTTTSTDTRFTGANTAVGNRVGETGKLYPGAVAIWVGQTFDNTITNNLVYNTTYTGISVGWTWGFGTATSGRNLIADNLLVNIGLGQLSDMGGIYLVGIAPGTVVSGNVIREVRGYSAYGAGAFGVYGDAGTSNVVFKNNLIVGNDKGSMHLTVGRSNTLLNNVFALGDTGELMVGETDPLTALQVQGNVFVPKTTTPFIAFAKAPDATYTGNVVTAQYLTATPDLTKCSGGCTLTTATLTTTTDPRGISLASNDTSMVNLVAQTAAKAGPASLVSASSVVTASVQKPPVIVAPPIGFTLDIANAAIGSQPLGFWYSTPASANVLNVVANATATAGKCLQYTDSPNNVNGYDPHTYAPMNHDKGTTTGEFSLLIDAQTNFSHQWRDNGAPVLTGPALSVTASGVYVAGKLVAPITVGGWNKFKVVAPLAGTGTTWSLTVTSPTGSVTTVNNLPFKSSGWGRLNWWGFVSGAVVSSKLCLADIKATNVQ